MKVLTGADYDLPRFVGIKAELWAKATGKEPPITDTQFATGNIVRNKITDEIGLLLNEDDTYFIYLCEPHLARLVDAVEDDWAVI